MPDWRADARAAAEQAVADDPNEIDAQVAAIVLGYDKDSPATAVGALGMLIKNDPQAASPVMHLGLLLLWIKRTALARQEFSKAVKLDPSGRIGRVAKAFLVKPGQSDGLRTGFKRPAAFGAPGSSCGLGSVLVPRIAPDLRPPGSRSYRFSPPKLARRHPDHARYVRNRF